MQNPLGQPIGESVQWQGATPPPRVVLEGQYCSVVPLTPAHAADLFAATQLDADGRNWTYLFDAPLTDLAGFTAWTEKASQSPDPLFHAIISAETGKAVGYATYMRITPQMGVIEIGNIHLSPALQGSRASTEAMYLLMKQAFALGYRRYEWKCDSLNAPSRRTALRLGFTFEGIFRQALVYKGRNRDTAWFSVTDKEWPALENAFVSWLDAGNFDKSGIQQAKLQLFR
ncbi:MAG: GNAT family N-acetyltransferase [Rhodobacteraceae bacterium]|nr:GNAT family N-acetyltransferase [Paracoccaceae bacterium]